MATANTMALAAQARRRYTEALVHGLAGVVQAVDGGARELLGKRAEHGEAAKRRQAAQQGIASVTRAGDLPRPGVSSSARMGKLSLVDDDTIEREILSSRLA